MTPRDKSASDEAETPVAPEHSPRDPSVLAKTPTATRPDRPAVPLPPRPAPPPSVPLPPARPQPRAPTQVRGSAPVEPAPPQDPPRPPVARPPSSTVSRPPSPTRPTTARAPQPATSSATSRPAPPAPFVLDVPPPPPPPPPRSSEIAAGQVFAGRYRIERQLGKGGMGAVYLARQEPLSRLVAIKVLHGTADEVVVARFQREARLIAQLQHPHIVGLIDFGEDEGRLYLVMEYIDGEPLTALLKREAPLSPSRACDIGIKVAEALAVAHDLNVVHRDVKPDNIMVLRSAGGQDFIKMLDFGVAKIKRDGEAQNTIETKAGLIVGSLRYISPEQVESGEISPRTDIYSFGCILYEMLAGRRVFDYPSPADCAIAHLTEVPKPPTVDGRPVRGPLVDLIMRCLEKKPSRRPADAREALSALMACRERPAEIDLEAPGSHTMKSVDGGLDVAQGARTIEARPVTLPQPTPSAVPKLTPLPERPLAARAPVEVAAPLAAPDRMPDIELRSARGGLKTEPQSLTGRPGSRVSRPETGGAGEPRRTWPWVVLGVLLVAGIVAVAFVLLRGAEPPGKPEGGTPTGQADAITTSDTAAAQASDALAVAPEVKAVAAQDPDAALSDATSEAEIAEVSDSGPTDATVQDTVPGTRIVTTPPGATVLRDGRPTCTTPCVVGWSSDEKPPLVRVRLAGHVDVDVQFVASDRGTEQSFTLSPEKP